MSDVSPLAPFHPLVRSWFTETLGEPTAPQRAGWPAIASGADTLILAPTGTGQDARGVPVGAQRAHHRRARAPLANAIHLLYVSPLKALNNDIQRNLELPLAAAAGALRARRRALSRDPRRRAHGRHAGVARARGCCARRRTSSSRRPSRCTSCSRACAAATMFSALRAVIVDEIHAVAGTKRGAHLALTLERLSTRRAGRAAAHRPLGDAAAARRDRAVPRRLRAPCRRRRASGP